ncbi:MAG: putative HTH-type transcriptional regulator YgaV [Candidatus Dichloromethanomonas elyunquensis]|nr:MAG: putative HTH-type transcriptional regulator YgaV [Candidatus Dichloromethanomonas elyunquensis]
MEEKAKKIAELLKILANENRLLILCVLKSEPHTVGEIHAHIHNITQSALSQHLTHLKTAGILDSEKCGMNVVYKIADERIVALMATLKEYYCKGEVK